MFAGRRCQGRWPVSSLIRPTKSEVEMSELVPAGRMPLQELAPKSGAPSASTCTGRMRGRPVRARSASTCSMAGARARCAATASAPRSALRGDDADHRRPRRRRGVGTGVGGVWSRGARAARVRDHGDQRLESTDDHVANRVGPVRPRLERATSRYRRSAKKARNSSPQSSARSPPATCGRWFSRGSARMSKTLPAAPALGSAAP